KIEMIEARLIAPGLVAGNESHAMRDIAMGKRHLQARGSGKPCGDAGGDLDLDAGVAQGCDLLACATEHERIAALEPHDGLTRSPRPRSSAPESFPGGRYARPSLCRLESARPRGGHVRARRCRQAGHRE